MLHGRRSACLMLGMMLAMLSSCAHGEGMVWRVTGGRNTMVLLGSIHVGSTEMYPFADSVLRELYNADTVVFECDTENPDALRVTKELMNYPRGETLKDHVSEHVYSLLEEVAEKTGYPMGLFRLLKPWAAVSVLSVETTAAELGTQSASQALALGVEKQIGLLTEGKTIRYLETAEQQLKIMDRFSPALQEYMLETACKAILHPEEATGMEATLKHWPKWWTNGNADAFAQNYLDSLASDPKPELMREYHEGLLLERNRQMAEELRRMLEEDEKHSFFVTVGLLHLAVPGQSIAHELEKMGYTVEKIMN